MSDTEIARRLALCFDLILACAAAGDDVQPGDTDQPGADAAPGDVGELHHAKT